MKINIERSAPLYITFLAILAATPPLATDMYLAAIPQIAEGWGVGKDVVNLTLVLWFGSFSVSTLISGSLSDKLGRKPVLFAGLIMFVVSSAMCALSANVYQLIFFRILQGIGAGAPSSIVMAIIRDRYNGVERQRALGYVMTIVAVAPMVAPIIGALLLEFFSWRFIFATQASMVMISLIISLGYKETISEKLDTGYLKLFSRYMVHIKNRPFLITSLSMGLLVFPFYSFIAFSPVYYISAFGLSEKMFSLFFAVNAVSAMSGAYLSPKISDRLGNNKTLTLTILGCVFAGVGILAFAGVHYLYMTVFMSICSFFIGVSRPVSGAIILGLVETDVGSASSFLVFYQFIGGAMCMGFVTMHWTHPIMVFGAVAVFFPVVVFMLWRSISGRINPVH